MLILRADELPFQALPGIYSLGEVLLRIKAASKSDMTQTEYNRRYRERRKELKRELLHSR